MKDPDAGTRSSFSRFATGSRLHYVAKALSADPEDLVRVSALGALAKKELGPYRRELERYTSMNGPVGSRARRILISSAAGNRYVRKYLQRPLITQDFREAGWMIAMALQLGATVDNGLLMSFLKVDTTSAQYVDEALILLMKQAGSTQPLWQLLQQGELPQARKIDNKVRLAIAAMGNRADHEKLGPDHILSDMMWAKRLSEGGSSYALTSLVYMINHKHRDPQLVEKAQYLLAQHPKVKESDLIALSFSKSQRTREIALRRLDRHGSRRAWAAMTKKSDSLQPAHRLLLARKLGTRGQKYLKPLLQGNDTHMRQKATRSYALSARGASLGTLRSLALDDSDRSVRVAAKVGLAYAAHGIASVLAKAENDVRPYVRHAAVMQMQHADRRPIGKSLLRIAAQDENHLVREAARTVLMRTANEHEWKACIDALTQGNEWERQAATYVLRWGPFKQSLIRDLEQAKKVLPPDTDTSSLENLMKAVGADNRLLFQSR